MAPDAILYPEVPQSAAVQICLDLPIPPSVNRLRRIDWANTRKHRQWQLHADLFIMANGPRPPPVRMINGPHYKLHIQIPDGSRGDLDNFCKPLIDYLVSREFTPDDMYLHGFT